MDSVNRIFCIGKNYAKHVAELVHLGHPADGESVIFMKPPSAIVPPGALQLPREGGLVHHEAELVVRLDGLTGHEGIIPASRAVSHVSHVTLGIDLTLRELQTRLKDRGASWEAAKAFDGSAPLGDWREWDQQQNLQKLQFSLSVNDEVRQRGDTSRMLFPVARIIEILSRSWQLANGDVIYTGTPAGVGELKPGDRVRLEGAGCGAFTWQCA